MIQCRAEKETWNTMGKVVLAILVSLLMYGRPRSVDGAARVNPVFQNLQVYPNPWRSDTHADKAIQIVHVPAGSSIKLFTVSGHFVRELMADSTGAARWDRSNGHGQPVASGLYVYLIRDPQGHTFIGQLALIK
jgi:hypothetical protein